MSVLDVIQEAIEAVSTLNDEQSENYYKHSTMFGLNNDQEYNDELSQIFSFQVQTNGLCVIIKFIGDIIWSSEDDERDYLDDKDEYEPLVPFLMRERDKMIENLHLYLEYKHIKGQFDKDGDIIKYNISEQQKDDIIKRLIKYYSIYCHFGEGIHQDDESIIAAPSVLSDICDNIILFEEEKDEMG